MFGGINPGQMKAMMKQMGIKQEEIDASRVIIEKNDGNRIVISPVQVQKMTMKGQVSWQITGEDMEESREEGIKQEDIDLVMEKTGKSEKEVREVLEETNDIAEAIVKLS